MQQQLTPRLFVVTREISASKFQSLADSLPEEPLTFIRQGEGLIGSGIAIEFSASGPNRMPELAELWRNLVAEATVQNPLSIPGTGLVAFGSFSFDDASQAKSLLVVAKRLLGSRDGRFWITEASLAADQPLSDGSQEAFDETWAVSKYRQNEPVVFDASAHSPEDFKLSVAKAIGAIESGGLQKVVLARDLIARVPSDFDLRPALARLVADYPTCWTYSVAGTFGASPELLVRVAHGQVSARVLAGTAARSSDSAIDRANSLALAASAKNIQEHAFAVDSLVASLSPFCLQVDADTEPFSLALPNVWHLASDVHGVLKAESSVLDLAASLHPTAAVAGTPRAEAVALIRQLEPFDRGRYAGPVVWIGADGDGEWAIALRGGQLTMDAAGGTLTAFAGCGIVAGSEPEAELAETELKFQPIRAALS